MEYEFEMDAHTHSISVSILDIPELLADVLRDNEIDTVGQLYDEVQSGGIIDIKGIGEKRRDQLAAAMKKLSVLRRSDAVGYVFSLGQLIFYLVLGIGVALIMYQTYTKNFDHDEIAVIFSALFTAFVFDVGRLVSRPNQGGTSMIAIHTRSLVIFCSIVITLVFATKNELAFNQESRRVIFCGIFLAVINGANQFFYSRYVSVPVSYTHLTLPTKRIV